MRGLLLRLSALDADAENAVRVIGFFDALITGKAGPETLVRETAKLAECPVGLTDAVTGVTFRAGGGGDRRAVVREVPGVGRVWLERGGAALPLDEIVLERFAFAAAVVLESSRLGDSGLVDVVLSADAREPERARALRLLGAEPTAGMHVLAVSAGEVPVADVLAVLPEIPRVASFGRVHAVLAGTVPLDLDERIPRGVRVGVGPALPAAEAPESWARARSALRFAAPDPPGSAVVHHERLGALAVIADRLGDGDITRIADVAALDRLASEPNGTDVIDLLTAFCETGSTRKAAARVHRHHSTVAVRLAKAESRLGFPFSPPGGRLRLHLAVLLRRLRDDPG